MVMKRLLIAWLLIPLTSLAETAEVNGVTWTYTVTNGCASIGSGSAWNAAIPRSTSGCVTVPSSLGACSVECIGDFAFYFCTNLTSVWVSSVVTNIGEYAFAGCRDLTSVSIPCGVMNIGRSAFDGCQSLETIIVEQDDVERVKTLLMESCLDVGRLAFVEKKADGGPYVQIVEGVEWTYVVSNGNAEVKFVPRVTTGTIAIPSVLGGCLVTSIGARAFLGCDELTSVEIPLGVTVIGNNAFANCHKLASVMIPLSVIRIEHGAFFF